MLLRTTVILFLTIVMAYSQTEVDNAAIYSTKKGATLKSLILSSAPSAQVTESTSGDKTVFLCTWPNVTVKVTVDPHWDGGVQLVGMKGWISRFPPEERDIPPVTLLLKQMDSTIDCFGCVISPHYDPDGKAASLITSLAAKLDGYIFSHQTFYNLEWEKIIGLPGDPLKL